jgi:hypothetical protein
MTESATTEQQRGVVCQLQDTQLVQLPAGPPSREEPWSWYLRRRGRAVKYKLSQIMDRLRQRPAPEKAYRRDLPAPDLQPGDRVRVLGAEAIRATLDESGRLNGCGFALSQYRWCGKELRVAKRVERFFDERTARMLKARNMVLLEGSYCDGTDSIETHGCDRMCFFFWRSEWLEKLDAAGTGRPGAGPPAAGA